MSRAKPARQIVMKSSAVLKIGAFLALVPLCIGCTRDPYLRVDSAQHHAIIERDQALIEARKTENIPLILDVDQAIDRALDKNLDGAVAAIEVLVADGNIDLETLNMLPNMRAGGTYSFRSNRGASSSQSVLTGTQSLEPSTSTDQDRILADLDVQWNTLDSLIALLDRYIAGSEESIAKERLRKVRHNIERDVTNAYWKSYAYQEAKNDLAHAKRQADRILDNLQAAQKQKLIPLTDAAEQQDRLLNSLQNLARTEEVAALALIEFKNLTAIPIEADFSLKPASMTLDKTYLQVLKQPTDDLVRDALLNRPEMREIIHETNIARENQRKEFIRSFPALDLLFGYNFDSNSFLQDQDWSDFNASLTQSVISVLTLPKRAGVAKDRRALVKNRRLALTAAIIAQIHIGKMRLSFAEENYRLAMASYEAAKRGQQRSRSAYFEGAESGLDQAVHQAEFISAHLRKDLAFASLQESYADFIVSLGRAPYGEERVAQND